MTKEELILNMLDRLMTTSDKLDQERAAKHHPAVGQYVIVRTYSAGVHAGTLAAANGPEVTLTDSRRIWRWGKDALSLSEVSQNGLDHDESRVACAVPVIYLTEAIEIIPCQHRAQTSIEGAHA